MNYEKEKKPLLLWQMIVMAVLWGTVIVSMFFSRIHLRGDMIIDIFQEAVENALEKMEISDLLSDYITDEDWDELRSEWNENAPADFSLSGLDVIFLDEETLIRKITPILEWKSMDKEELDEEVEQAMESLETDSSFRSLMDSFMNYFGYMRVGYLLIYIAALILLILSVLWFVFRWDRLIFGLINLLAAAGGTFVTLAGTLDLSSHGENVVKQLFSEWIGDGSVGSIFDSVVEKINFSKPSILLWRSMNMTFGGVGCMIVCILLFLFSAVVMVTGKKSKSAMSVGAVSMAAPIGAAPMGNMAAPMGAAPMGTAPVGSVPIPTSIGKVTVTRGEFQGASLEIKDGEEVILGRDPSICHLVFSQSEISRKHCGIRYDSRNNVYFVINYSSNGTSLLSGQNISSDTFVQVAPGNTIELAGGKEEISLG